MGSTRHCRSGESGSALQIEQGTPLCLAFALLLGGLVLPLPAQVESAIDQPASGGETSEASVVGHGERSEPLPYEALAVTEIRSRMKRLQGLVMCACKEENWSRTLANCPDACADPQKRELLAGIQSNQTDDEIIEQQVRRYGSKARANPIGIAVKVLPFLALFIGAWFAGSLVRNWQRAGTEARERRQHQEVSPEEIARIQRDLDALE